MLGSPAQLGMCCPAAPVSAAQVLVAILSQPHECTFSVSGVVPRSIKKLFQLVESNKRHAGMLALCTFSRSHRNTGSAACLRWYTDKFAT
jgi:hypothetical protein